MAEAVCIEPEELLAASELPDCDACDTNQHASTASSIIGSHGSWLNRSDTGPLEK